MRAIKVNLNSRSYSVTIGRGICGQLPGRLTKLVKGKRLFVIYDAQVFALYGRKLDRVLGRSFNTIGLAIPGGEKSKSQAHLSSIYNFLLSEKISRTDTILAIGGGVISDLAGYAAATTLRGIQWAVVPTTLVGMVDAAIGGKTGINHPEGKNLIGAYHQPCMVWGDTEFLMTLPSRQMMAGFGEVLKYAGLMGKPIAQELAGLVESVDIYDLRAVERVIRLCAKYKADLVSVDEFDMKERMVLNLGHTFGHAIEAGTRYGSLLHGEAITLGLRAAVHLSGIVFPESKASLAGYISLIESVSRSLPRRKIDLNKVYRAMFMDKKQRQKRPNFILLKKLGKPIIATDINLGRARKSLFHALDSFELGGDFNG